MEDLEDDPWWSCGFFSELIPDVLEPVRWDVMMASGIKPNRITYNILISSCAKVGEKQLLPGFKLCIPVTYGDHGVKGGNHP